MRSTKWVIAAISAIACALTLSGCSVAPTTAGEPDPTLRGQWVRAALALGFSQQGAP
jgi:hypothetical protein